MNASGIEIGVATEAERQAALRLVLRNVAPGARAAVVDAVAAQPPQRLGPLDALIVARASGGVVAAVWAQPSPGRTAGLWLPEAADGGVPEATAPLIAAALAVVDRADVAITQALFDAADDPRIGAVESAGFDRVAELHYLSRALRGADARRDPPQHVVFDACDDSDRLHRALRAAYVDSLDCPAMEGRRELADVVAGYRATGRHDARDWFIVRSAEPGAGGDIGVLLLADHPGSQQYELVYMGLAPAARGRGLGGVVVGEAMRVAALRGAEQLMVAVDAANAPAVRVYERAGFASWARKLVYVR